MKLRSVLIAAVISIPYASSIAANTCIDDINYNTYEQISYTPIDINANNHKHQFCTADFTDPSMSKLHKLALALAASIKSTKEHKHSKATSSTNISENDADQDCTFYVRGSAFLPTYRYFEKYSSTFRAGGSAAIGLDFNPNFSVELETLYFKFPISFNMSKNGDNRAFRAWSGFLNLIFKPKFINARRIKPFGGIGLGLSRIHLSDSTSDLGIKTKRINEVTNTKFTYQAFIGLEYFMFSNVAFLADLHFIDFGRTSVPHPPPLKSLKRRTLLQSLNISLKFQM